MQLDCYLNSTEEAEIVRRVERKVRELVPSVHSITVEKPGVSFKVTVGFVHETPGTGTTVAEAIANAIHTATGRIISPEQLNSTIAA